MFIEWRVELLKEQAEAEAKAAKERLEEAAAKRAKAVYIAAWRGTLRANQN